MSRQVATNNGEVKGHWRHKSLTYRLQRRLRGYKEPPMQRAEAVLPCSSQRKKRWCEGLVVDGTTNFPFRSRSGPFWLPCSSSFSDLEKRKKHQSFLNGLRTKAIDTLSFRRICVSVVPHLRETAMGFTRHGTRIPSGKHHV